MGAIQAQDFLMAKWAIGARLLNSSEKQIEASLDKGEIIRTHLLRPTWHFVAANDVYWMLELTAPRIKPQLKSRQKQLELTDAIFAKSRNILEKALHGKRNLTRGELSALYRNAGIKTNENRLSHLLHHAELDGIICSGPAREKKPTYSLLYERVPARNTFTRDESLAALAERYFTSHGPATIRDFTWWSGLPVSDARKALDFIRSEFVSETINSLQYWFNENHTSHYPDGNYVFLLPAFDEFLIAYADRSAALSLTDNPKTISNNGIFRPFVVINGQVSGLWKRVSLKDKLKMKLTLFRPVTKTIHRLAEEEAQKFAAFSGKEVTVKILY